MNKTNLKQAKIGRGPNSTFHAVDPDRQIEGSLNAIGICGTKGRSVMGLFEYNNEATPCLRCNIKLGFVIKDELIKIENNYVGVHGEIGFTQTNYKVIKDHYYRGTYYKTGEIIYGRAYDNAKSDRFYR
tara:strand:+ start:201 stop:587 length:387 start_codon:yes stop_codon:yes gene_type:complete